MHGHTLAHIYTCTLAHPHTYTHSLIEMYTYTQTYVHGHTLTHIHTCTLTLVCTYIHTFIHTHNLSYTYSLIHSFLSNFSSSPSCIESSRFLWNKDKHDSHSVLSILPLTMFVFTAHILGQRGWNFL